MLTKQQVEFVKWVGGLLGIEVPTLQPFEGNTRQSTTTVHNDYTGGACPLAQSLRSYRHHHNLKQWEVVNLLNKDGFTKVHNTTISSLEAGKLSFTRCGSYNVDGHKYSFREMLDRIFGSDWRKNPTPVRAHNRVVV